jgi:MFS family permease
MTDAASAHPLRTRDLLRIADFRKLFLAQAISDVGDGMTYLALYLLVLGTTGSTLVVAIMAVLIALPPVTIGLFAGAYADRLDRRRILIVSDSLRAVVVLSLVFLQGPGTIPLVLGLACLQAAIGTFFSPARAALIPRVVPPEGLLAANSLGQMSRVIGSVLGLAITGAIAGSTGLTWPAFLLDSLTFLASVALVSGVGRDIGRIESVAATAARARGMRGSVADGLRAIAQSRSLVAVVGGMTVMMLGAGAIYVLFVPFVVRDLAASPVWIGPIEASQSASMILASIVLTAIAGRVGVSSLFVIGLAGVAACIATLSQATAPWMVMAVLFAQGWFFLPVQATTMTIVQQATTDAIRGRVVGAVGSFTQTAMILSMAAAGIVSDAFGIRAVFLLSGMTIGVGAAFAWLLFRSAPRVAAPAPAATPG